MYVLERDEVASDAEDEPFNGIERHEVSRVFRREILWLAQYFLSVYLDDSSCTGNLLRHSSQPSTVRNETCNGTGFGAGQLLFATEHRKQGVQLFTSQIWVFLSKSPQLLNDTNVPQAFALFLGSSVAVIPALEFPLTRRKLRLPQVQGTFLYSERFLCSYGAVLLPKGQYSDPLLCLLGNHIPEA